MKFKRLFVASLTALMLLLSSCSGSQLEEPLSQEYETIIGEFLSLGGIAVDKTITHLFEDDDGNIYYAYSDRYDLDDELSIRVEVAGLVMEYESLDKPAFNVTRITDAPEETLEDKDITMVNYTDTELGFSMTYPDNWTFESFRDSVQLTAPLAELKEDEEPIEADVIIIASLSAELRTSSEDEMADRATDVRTQVATIYPDLSELEDQVTMIGLDQQFALRYKTDNGDISYFIPQGSGLLELSFYHPSEDSSVDNSNVFSEIVSTFRLLPTGDSGEFIDDVEEEIQVEEVEKEESTSEATGEQEVVSGFREFESNPFKFKMSYPGSWYYSGGNQGYDFSTDPIEDDTTPLIRMDINASENPGVVRTSTEVQITVEVGGQFYTLNGPSKYENVMQKMANSIQPVTTEEV